jgi:hypothetical protein
MTRVQNDSKNLASEYTRQKADLEKMTELAETARLEGERAKKNHRCQVQELGDRLRESTTASTAEEEEMRRQMSELKQRLNRPKEGFFVNIGRAPDSIFF